MTQGGPVIPSFGKASTCVRDNGAFCWDWVQAHWDDTLRPALVQHVELTLVAVGVGFAIAFAAAVLAQRVRPLKRPFDVFAALFYTIPSLALFQLLVPLTGLTWTTIEIALVSYTLLILFRNILAGLRGVPDDVRESARGMGLTRLQALVRVELPLAVPAIVAGLRIAVVSTISIATIAGFVVLNKGLGRPIYDGIRDGVFKTEIVAAGALAVGLALVSDAALVLVQRLLTPWARRRAA